MLKKLSFFRSPKTTYIVKPEDAVKRESRIRKLLASLDKFVVRITLTCIVLYVVMYGLTRSGGFHTELSLVYLFTLIPIWLVDGFKSLIETFTPRPLQNWLRGHEQSVGHYSQQRWRQDYRADLTRSKKAV